MAKIPAGILGAITGKVGNVVGASWKGIAYIREYVIPANPNTDAQKAERDLFRDIVNMASAALGPVLQVFVDPFLRAQSAWAHFIGDARKTYLVQGTYDNIVLTKGTLEGAVVIAAIYGGGNVTLTWSEAVLGNGALTDIACVFVYDKANKVGWFDSAHTRDDEGFALAVGTGREATDLNAWLFFADHATVPTIKSYSDYEQVALP